MDWFCVELDQGDYLQQRGGWDWGRVENWLAATRYESAAEADYVARVLLPAGYRYTVVDVMADLEGRA